MKKSIYIGIDVSSETLDICTKEEQSQSSVVIKNQVKDILKFFRPFLKENVIVAMENTGRYNWQLYEALSGLQVRVYVVSPLHLKKSLGLVRGKNDKIDAVRIVDFIFKNHDSLTPWERPALSIQKLKVLLTERNYRIKTKRQLLTMQHDYSLMKTLGLDKSLQRLNKKLIAEMDEQVEKIEQQIQDLVNTDAELKQKAELIRSVPGVGKVLSWTILSKTNGFKTITSARRMACYSGVVPFPYQSGTSVMRKPRVSAFADKTMKSILHLAAMSAIRLNNDLRTYYLRKVKEGKNKMSVLNAVRNKILLRIYAVIKNQTPYSNNLVLS